MIRQGGGCKRCPSGWTHHNNISLLVCRAERDRPRDREALRGWSLFFGTKIEISICLVAVESSRPRKRRGAVAAVSTPFLFQDAFLVGGRHKNAVGAGGCRISDG